MTSLTSSKTYCEHELDQSVDGVEAGEAGKFLELAARTSSANYDQYKDERGAASLRPRVPDGQDHGHRTWRMSWTSSRAHTSTTRLDAFLHSATWSSRCPWCCSITRRWPSIRCFQTFLLIVSTLRGSLSAVWITNKQTKFLPGRRVQGFIHPAFGLGKR